MRCHRLGQMHLTSADWPTFGWMTDLRPGLANARSSQRFVVLGTLVEVVGSSPRPVGTQMLFTGTSAIGYFSGGCLEADVANHARAVFDDGQPRWLLYGKGSPWIDIRLLCGGSLRVLLERIPYDDPAVSTLLELSAQRRRVLWGSDGDRRTARECDAVSEFTVNDIRYSLSYDPPWRVVIVGGDPIALAIANLSVMSGFDTTIIRPNGPASSPPIAGVSYVRGDVSGALASIAPDAWTAVVTATHDDDIDDAAILAAYHSAPAYVGVLGSARRLAARRKRLWAAGLRERQIASLHAPIGAARCGKAPWEVAASVIAEIMQIRTDRATFMVSAGSDTQPRAIALQNVHEL